MSTTLPHDAEMTHDELAELQSCATMAQFEAVRLMVRERRGGAQPPQWHAESTQVWQSLSDRPRRRGGRR